MGILLELISFAVFAVAAVFFITQVIVPIFDGTRLFPMFRKRGEIQEKLVIANEELRNVKLENEVKEVKGKIKKEGGK